MYVTVYELNARDKRTCLSVANRNEMHRDVESLCACDGCSGKYVYRVAERKGKLLLYIYSEIPTHKENAHFGMKFLGEGEIDARKNGDAIRIDVLATPIQTITDYNGKKKKRPIFDATKRLEWCKRKALANGFRIDNIAEAKKEVFHIDKHNGKSEWRVDAYEYKLEATIVDEDKFRECMMNGFGRNRAYGAGMMFIAG